MEQEIPHVLHYKMFLNVPSNLLFLQPSWETLHKPLSRFAAGIYVFWSFDKYVS